MNAPILSECDNKDENKGFINKDQSLKGFTNNVVNTENKGQLSIKLTFTFLKNFIPMICLRRQYKRGRFTRFFFCGEGSSRSEL